MDSLQDSQIVASSSWWNHFLASSVTQKEDLKQLWQFLFDGYFLNEEKSNTNKIFLIFSKRAIFFMCAKYEDMKWFHNELEAHLWELGFSHLHPYCSKSQGL